MKRVLALLLCLVLVMAVFASCKKEDGSGAAATPGEKDHVHAYATELSKDANGHWYAPTCGCEETKTSHADKNNDGLCDVCEYNIGNHTHTYSEEWTVDCTNHWHAADCGHIIAGTDLAKHADENADGKCDVCAYVINDIHKHYYDTAWTNDAEYHWHAALCEHNVEVDGKEAHEVNAAGYCTVCKAKVKDVDTTKILAVLEAALAQNDKIIDGSVIARQDVYGGTGKEILETGLTNRVYFVLGNGQSYINYKSYDVDDNFIGVDEQWYQRISDEEVFAVVLENGETELAPASGDAQFLNGYSYYPGSILPSDSDDTSTLANTLWGLYNIKVVGTNVSEAEESYNAETGMYSFSYRYFTVNATQEGGETRYGVELFYTKVEFSINEDYVIDVANFSVEVYRDFEADSDFTYDPQTNTVTLKDTANPTVYSYNVSQNSGERTFTTPYPRKSLIPTDFELSYVTSYEYDDMSQLVITGETLITDTLTLDEGEYTRLHLGNAYPMTSSFNFINTEDFEFTFKNKDANSTSILWKDEDFLKPSYSAYSDCITFKAAEAGTYEMTIRFGTVSKTITIVVEGEKAPEVGEDTDTTINVVVTDNNTWVDKYSYTAKAEGTYTFTVPSGIGVWNVNDCDNNPFTTQPEVDYYGNGGTFSVGLKANEKFEFYVASAEKGKTAVITVAFEAGTVSGGDNDDNQGGNVGGGTIAADISGTYQAGSYTLVINNNGTMTLDIGSRIQNYTYEINGTTVTYTLNGGMPYSTVDGVPQGMAQYFGYLTFGDDGMPKTFEYNGSLTLVPATGGEGGEGGEGGDEGGEDEDPIDITGTYYGTDGFGNQLLTVVIDANKVNFTFNHPMMGEQTASYTYAIVDGAVVLYLDNGDVAGAMYGYITLTDNVPTAAGYNGNDYTLSTKPGAVESPEGTEANPIEITIPATDLSAEGDAVGYTWYTFTTTNAGILTITFSNANSWVRIKNVDDAEDSNSGSQNQTLTFRLQANSTYIVGLGVWEAEEGVTASLSFEVSEGNDLPNKGNIFAGEENTISVTADDITAGAFTVTFMPLESGEYELSVNDFFITSVADEEGNTVTINSNYRYELESMVRYIITISTQYLHGAGNYTITPTYHYPEGHQENPYLLGFDYEFGTPITVTYKGDYQTFWYTFFATADGVLTVSTENANALILLTSVFGNEIEGTSAAPATINVIKGRQYYIGVVDKDFSSNTYDITFTPSFTAGEYVGNGTVNTPNILTVGSNTANVPQSEVVWFVYKFTANGTLTLTTENTNCEWYISSDLSKYTPTVTGGTISIEGSEGNLVYIYVSTINMEADTVNFTASLKAAPTEVYFEGQVNTNGSNTITIADNTWASLSFNGMGQYQISWDNANVKVELLSFFADNTVLTNGGIISGDMWGTNLKIYFPEYAAGTVNLTIVPYVEPAKNLTVGENTVSVTDTQMGNTVNLPVSNENDVTYTVTVGTNGVVIYNSSNYFAGNTVDITVPAGQTVSFNVATYDRSASDVVITVAIKASAEGGDNSGDNGNSQPNLKGSGTQSDPYIIESLPFEITVEGTHDFFIRGTAAADCVLVITYPDGGFVSNLPEGWTKDEGTMTYTIPVKAGDVITANLWTMRASGTFTYTVKIGEATTPDEGGNNEGGNSGNEGGTTTNAVIYLSAKHASGRILQVIIDTSAGTMKIVRSDLTGSFTTASVQTSEYTYSFDGTTVTATNVSGQVCTITWNADGSPASITWGSAKFENFTVQA